MKTAAEWYHDGFLSTLNGDRTIGEELELPVVDGDGRAASARCLWPQLIEAGWRVKSVSNPFRLSLNGFDIMPEASWSTLEVATPPFSDLATLARSSAHLMGHLVSLAGRHGLRLLGYGTQPLTPPRELKWVNLPRYHILRQALGDAALTAILAAASQQCHVQVTRQEAIPLLNVYNGLSGLLNAMFAHAPIQEGRRCGVKTVRQCAYDGFPPDRVGALPRLEHLSDWVRFLLARHYLFHRDGQGSYSQYGRPLHSYLRENAATVNPGQTVAIIQNHEATLWPEARLRWRPRGECTVELRTPCPQRPGEHSVSAVALGLAENLDEASQLLDELSWEQWRAVRQMSIRRGLDFSFPALKRPVKKAALDLLAIARRGLKTRGRNEEALLAPIQERVAGGRCLADEAVASYDQGGLAKLLESVAWPVVD